MTGPRDVGGSRGGRDDALPPLPPELDPRRSRRAGARRPARPARHSLHRARAVGRVVAALISASLVVYIGFLWSRVHNIDTKVPRLSLGAISDPKTPGGQTQYDVDGKDQNLLIVGNDERSDMTPAERRLLHTGSDVSLSTDTMMIVHIPADGSRATLISLPRDSYVAIPGNGMSKLNSAYADGYLAASGGTDAKRAAGANLLVQTVQNLTGLHLDHYVQVGLIGFYRIAKAVGGVPVTLCHNVDDSFAHNSAVGLQGGSGFAMSAGHHVLTAVQALAFVRQRHFLPRGDIDRTARQRYFLTAAFRKVASAGILLSPNKLGNLVNAVDQSLYVDSGLKILDLAKQMANLSANNIVGRAIPFERFATVDVGSVEIVDPAKVRAFVNRVITGAGSAYGKATTVDPSSVTVSVVNAGAHNGAATAATHTLASAGFHATVGPDASGSQSASVIEFPAGMESQAKTLARYVPGATAQQADVTTVTLVLGSDGATARATPAAAPTSGRSGSASPSSSASATSANAIDAHCIN